MLQGIYCLALGGHGRPHVGSAQPENTPPWSNRGTTYPNSFISQPTAPLENKAVAYGLGRAASMARDPISVHLVETTALGGGGEGGESRRLCPRLQNNGLS